jgi:hypothetical protein
MKVIRRALEEVPLHVKNDFLVFIVHREETVEVRMIERVLAYFLVYLYLAF